jgi:hypothetical protein
MATKVAPKAKTETKTKVDAKAKEAQAAAIAKAVEKEIPAVVELIQANIDAESSVSQTFLELVDGITEIAENNEFDRDAVTLLVKSALVTQYNDGKPSKNQIEAKDVGSHAVLKFKLSRIVNLASPKTPEIAKQLSLAREKGVKIADLNKVATGGITAAQAAKSLGRGGNVKAKSQEKNKNGAKVIEDADAYGSQFAGLLGRVIAGGVEDSEIAEMTIEQFAAAIFKRDASIDEDSFSEMMVEATNKALAKAQANNE